MDGSQFIAGRPGWAKAPLVVADTPNPYLRRDLSEQALAKPPEPSFTTSEMDAARADGYADGHAAGLAEAAASYAAATLEAVRHISALLTTAQGEAARVTDAAATAGSAALVAALNAVMPELIQRSALGETTAMLRHVAPALSREPQLRIDVPPPIADGVRAALQDLPPALLNAVEVVGAETMAPGDARISWAAGRATRQPAEVWRRVMQSFDSLLGKAEVAEKTNDH